MSSFVPLTAAFVCFFHSIQINYIQPFSVSGIVFQRPLSPDTCTLVLGRRGSFAISTCTSHNRSAFASKSTRHHSGSLQLSLLMAIRLPLCHNLLTLILFSKHMSCIYRYNMQEQMDDVVKQSRFNRINGSTKRKNPKDPIRGEFQRVDRTWIFTR